MGIKEEKPKPAGWRVYQSHKTKVVRQAKKEKVSEGEIVRRAIDAYCV